MTLYGTPQQIKKSPGFYKEFPTEEYIIELMKKINENQNKKNPLENKISLN